MTEGEIFLAATEISDSAERMQYVVDACSGDVDLKMRVIQLLQAHQEASQFLQTPAMSELQGHVKNLQDIHRETDDQEQHSAASEETTIQQDGDAEAGLDDEEANVQEEFRRCLAPSTTPDWLGNPWSSEYGK